MKKRMFLMLLCLLTLTVSLCLFTACDEEGKNNDDGGTTENGGSTEGGSNEGGSNGGGTNDGGTGGSETPDTAGITFKTLAVNGTKVSGAVSNATETFSFINEINATGGAKYVVSLSVTGSPEIISKTIELKVGDNTAYVIEMIDGEPTAVYTVTIRRKPVYEVFFISNGSSIADVQRVEEGSLATEPNVGRVGYTHVWNHDFNAPITGNLVATATYTPITYTATFKVDGVTVDTRDFTVETESITPPSVPDKTGYNGVWENYTLGAESITVNAVYTLYSEGLEYTLSSDETYYTVTGIGTCTDTDIVIPSVYEGKPVKVIGESAFEYCESLTSVTIPDSVTSIGYGAFRECYSLTNVTIGNGVTSIGEMAFALCPKLTSISVLEDNIAYKTIEGNLYTKDGKNLIQYAIGKKDISFDIPSGVTSIGMGALYYSVNLKSVTLPNSVTNIGIWAFASCEGLATVTIPESVISIGEGAFVCGDVSGGGLNSIEVSDKNPAYKSIDGNLYTKDGKTIVQYATGKTATSFVIPSEVECIGNSAFYGCMDLANVTMQNGITTIGDSAFGWCTDLLSITIPESVVCIGDSAFYCCFRLSSVIFDGNSQDTSIGNKVFSSCSALTSITIPGNLISIGSYAFDDCNRLTSITVAEENTAYKSIDGNLYSKDGKTLIQYAIGKTATSFTIPDSVTSIGERAFEYCDSLTSVTIGNSVETIGDWAFLWCDSLTIIKYRGTETQWSAITKGSDWDSGTENYTITYNYTGE